MRLVKVGVKKIFCLILFGLFYILSILVFTSANGACSINLTDAILDSNNLLNLKNSEVLYFNFNNSSWAGESEETICDYSGNNNAGENFGAKWNSSGGIFSDGSFEFNGSSYISVPDKDNFSVNETGEVTIAFWINPATFNFNGEDAGYVNFLGKGLYDTQNQMEWEFRMYNSSTFDSVSRSKRISFYVFNISGGWGVGSYFQDSLNINEWFFVAGVINETHTKIYKNGVLRDSDLYQGIIFPKNSISNLNIGTVEENSYLIGSIDELRIFNRALNESEINSLYHLSFSNLNESTFNSPIDTTANNQNSGGSSAGSSGGGNSNIQNKEILSNATKNLSVNNQSLVQNNYNYSKISEENNLWIKKNIITGKAINFISGFNKIKFNLMILIVIILSSIAIIKAYKTRNSS